MQATAQSDITSRFPLLIFTRTNRPVYAMLEKRVFECLNLSPAAITMATAPNGQQVVIVPLEELMRAKPARLTQLANALQPK